MGKTQVTESPIKGLYVIEPTVYGDDRGYFVETYNQQDMHETGLRYEFCTR
ncbi:dTDP-4-dehydrorhamnose 3,5-epimerase family protein [Aerococcus urinaeequi]|jgi:dTDP-4-dehydrorhamnose 3,5-epimerase|uniref:dTDP-4-dehydrorhamnose 3,5-epimerase family protein n=1 Tax=Aerococcus urinaeequi TaxID=51665 RepID=UPI00366F7100